MKKINKWEKEFDEKLRWFMAGEGSPNDLLNFIRQLLQQARREGIEETLEKIGEMEFKCPMCRCRGKVSSFGYLIRGLSELKKKGIK